MFMIMGYDNDGVFFSSFFSVERDVVDGKHQNDPFLCLPTRQRKKQ